MNRYRVTLINGTMITIEAHSLKHAERVANTFGLWLAVELVFVPDRILKSA